MTNPSFSSLSCLALLCAVTSLSAHEGCCLPDPNTICIGPEFYHVNRTREGGTEQNGWIFAGRASYDRVKRMGVYYGATALYGAGTIDGASGSGAPLRSTFKDYFIEGRVGFTFQSVQWIQPSISPYIGLGYFKECNEYRSPSPLELHFNTQYPYIALGFLSSVNIGPQFSFGLNVKAAAMYDANCEVSNDPEEKDSTMIIEDKINYRVELPFIYRLCPSVRGFEVQVTPFYEHRHYGGRENFPFDFLDTKLSIWGFNVLVGYRF